MKTDLSITSSKTNADPAKYLSLFGQEVLNPLPDDSKMMVYSINNVGFIMELVQANPESVYYIVGHSLVNDAVKSVSRLGPGRIFFYDEESVDSIDIFKEINMKFDRIIMNPPYNKNLHLKILAEAITHLKDDNSKVVNLSPARWLQDPLAKYKKNNDYHRFEKSVSKHIEKMDIITAHDSQQCFDGTVMNIDLGIYGCTIQNNNFDISSIQDHIANKVASFTSSTSLKIESNKKDGWRVRMPLICGGKSGGSGDRDIGLVSLGKLLYFKDGKTPDGSKWWHECYRVNQYSKTTQEITSSIKVDSELHAKNFIEQFDTNFCKYCMDKLLSDVHVAPEKVIWMGDSINPRTGKKGYESEWTDEDFYQFFNITDDEKKVIEETMAKYVKQADS